MRAGGLLKPPMKEPVSPNSELVVDAEAATRRAPSHARNEDAFFADIAGGLFAIADGMGGHRDGHVASNAITSILGQTLDPSAAFETKIEAAARAISTVSGTLYAQSMSVPGMDISGSTVVSLIVGEGYGCCLWAGDSRLYLYRDEEIYLLSEDHVGAGGALTRAVGSAATLALDRRIIELRDGDIFMLCSDGLLKGIDEDGVAQMLAGAGDGLAERLLARAIAGGSGDDITLILVWVHGHAG